MAKVVKKKSTETKKTKTVAAKKIVKKSTSKVKLSKEKIGIFGGSFNPVHNGHLNLLQTVTEKLNLSKVFVVPNNQNPLKISEHLEPANHRIKMLELALKDETKFVIDDQEIKRSGMSYTIETLRYYASKYSPENIYLILGADSFETFDQWKNFEEILSEVNLVVTSRPKSELPYEKESLPKGIQKLVKDIDFKGVVKLKGGRTIQFVQLKDLDISATQIRKNLKLKKNVDTMLSFEVESYIKENNLYPVLKVKIPDFKSFALFAANHLKDKKALSIKAFDLSHTESPAEYTLVCSGTSTKQAQGFAESLIREVKEEYGVHPLNVEGLKEARWVVIDYGALIIHVFYDYVRNEYRLEDLWKVAKEIRI